MNKINLIPIEKVEKTDDEIIDFYLSNMKVSNKLENSIVDEYFEEMFKDYGIRPNSPMRLNGTVEELKRFIELFLVMGKLQSFFK